MPVSTLTSRKTTKPDHTKEGLQFLARTNLYRLSREILGYKDMTDAFHRPMLLWSQTRPEPKKLHMAARGTYKSSGIDVAKRVQYILKHPERCSLIGSNKAENAQAFLSEIKGHLESELLIWLFPDILWRDASKESPTWTKSAITVKRPKGLRPRKEATIETNGVEGELVSKHFEHGTFDDLVAKENSETRVERQKVIDWYESAQALVDQPSPDLATQDIIGTPWHWDDLYAHLLKKREKGDIDLAVYFMPCWLPDPNGDEVPGRGRMRATFPEKLSIPALLKQRKAMPLRFPAQYELTPADQDTAVFKRHEPSASNQYGIPPIMPRSEQPRVDQMWLAITIDPAISQKGWADYSALTVCGWDHENRQHVLWLKWGTWEPTRLIEETYLAYNHFAYKGNAPTVVGFEAVAFQRLYMHLFREAGEKRNQFLPVTKLERDTKHTKQTRQLVLEPVWNSGELVLYDDLDALAELLDMASKFRIDKELTRDDLLDVLADNHQLRVRPAAADPHPQISNLPEEEQPMARYTVEVQERLAREKRDPLDEASLRMAWLHHKRKTDAEQAQYADSLGFSEEANLWA